MMRLGLACLVLLFPTLGLTCESVNREQCKQRFTALVTYRTQAITTAFGDLLDTLPTALEVRFVGTKELVDGKEIYDQEQHTLVFPRRLLSSKVPNPIRAAAYYWPFYENEQYRNAFPVVETIDQLIWTAYLQEAAKARGLSWPHKDCKSSDLAQRLPCEMLVEGINEHLKEVRTPIFNANRLDLIWPEDFARFRRGLWNKGDQTYLDVQRYGGILLIGPLIDQFGVPRALAYFAQTPFQIEDNNVRLSAQRYQERARQELD
ncbi:MAG TPA: hypothetical protein VGD45_17435 [Steroidobacter sp.]|jgi:hypothetical protein|uniref:hypothetical protein n=1 Tax=Steroidobacter sp. TaxID=1978227 RepID=UPI002ED90D75